MRLTKCTTNSLREALTVLRGADDLLVEQQNWTQMAWARDAGGTPVLSTAPEARAWCIAGAVVRSNHDRFPGSKQVRMACAPKTGLPVYVDGPKRVVLALRLLALPMAFIAATARGDAAASLVETGDPQAAREEVDMSVIAVAANDLPYVAYDHIRFALAWAIDDVRAELSDRRQRSGA